MNLRRMDFEAWRRFEGQRNRLPKSSPVCGVKESSVVHSCQENLSHLILFTFGAERCCWVKPADPGFERVSGSCPLSLHGNTCMSQPQLTSCSTTPEASGAIFWIRFLVKHVKIGPAYLYLGVAVHWIVVSCSSSTVQARTEHTGRGDHVSPHTQLGYGFLWVSDASQDDATKIIARNWRPHTTNKPNGKQIRYIWPNYNCKYCIKQIAAVSLWTLWHNYLTWKW